MAELLNIEDYISDLMKQGVSPNELISRTMRGLYRLEDVFLSRDKRNLRNAVRACIAHARMIYDHERLMFSAKEYLLRKIESLRVRERDLNFEISILRAASSGEYSGRKSNDDSHDLGVRNCGGSQSGNQSNSFSCKILDSSVILDRESILREIDKSELNLGNLSEEIAHKKRVLAEIDMRFEDATYIVPCEERQVGFVGGSPSSFAPASTNIGDPDRGERTRSNAELRSRGGVPRTQTPLSSMNMSDKIMETSEEFGTSGRLGDAVPGVARSSSNEGYSRMGAACVREEVATAAVNLGNIEGGPAIEQDDMLLTAPQSEEVSMEVEDVSVPSPSHYVGKRKAYSSPELGSPCDVVTSPMRRPNKARAVEQMENTPPDESPIGEFEEIGNSEENRLSASPTENVELTILTRSAKKKVMESTDNKLDKSYAKDDKTNNKDIHGDVTEVAFKSSIIDSDSEDVDGDAIVSCELVENSDTVEAASKCDEGNASLSNLESNRDICDDQEIFSLTDDISIVEGTDRSKISSRPHTSSKRRRRKAYVSTEDDSEYTEEIKKKVTKSKDKNKTKTKIKAKKDKDPTVKNPIALPKGKKTFPESVSKERAKLELGYFREHWVKMSGPELGAICIDHLTEMERQRYLCNNLNGEISGMMKNCGAVAKNIVGALIEKLESEGDASYLKIQNMKLREDLSEAKRKMDKQELEIGKLRKDMIRLERELNNLKEGGGPYRRQAEIVRMDVSDINTLKKDMEPFSRRQPSSKPDIRGRSASLVASLPGSSLERNREEGHVDWPAVGSEAMDWTPAPTSSPPKEKRVDRVMSNRLRNNNAHMVINKKISMSSDSPRVREDIRIVENRQLVPPSASAMASSFPLGSESTFKESDMVESEWSAVNRSGRTRAKPYNRKLITGYNQSSDTPDSGSGMVTDKRIQTIVKNKSDVPNNSLKPKLKPKFKPKLNRPAVVTITGLPGGATYAQILGKAKQSVSLGDLGIKTLRMRRAMNGALVLELPGPEGKELAGSLRNTLQDVLQNDAIVNNPVASGELRLRGIDPATTQDEIAYVLEKISGCPPKDLKVSNISFMRDGMGVAWAHCPLEFAVKIAEKGSITLGWSVVRIELQKKRPIQCFGCWRFGHVKNNCKSKADRTGACFRCGLGGHPARECSSLPRCVICAEDEMDFRHRIGSTKCLQNQGFPSGPQSLRRAAIGTVGGTVQSQGP